MFSENELQQIVTQSGNLREKMFGEEFAPEQTTAELQENEYSHWNLWKEKVAQGDEVIFRKRLECWNLDSKVAYARLASIFKGETFPRWTNTLQEMFLSLKEAISLSEELKSQSIPFIHVYFPFLVMGQKKLQEAIPSLLHLSDHFLKILLKNLSDIAHQTLFFEFNLLQKIQGSSFDFLYQETTPPPTQFYDSFTQNLIHGGWKTLWMEYAVLARLMAEEFERWLLITTEFAHRFLKDRDAIQKTFFSQTKELKLTSITGNLSDPHRSGRTVFSLKFEEGYTLIYKPKNIDIDSIFGQFANWCTQDLDLNLKIPKTLCRPEYGWVEYISSAPCKSSEEAERYYERAGMLLSLLYILGGNDAHSGNLIASGEYPVFIDLETLFHIHPTQSQKANNARDELIENLSNSVTKSGLLPDQTRYRHGYYDPSGLGIAQQNLKSWQWIHLNTDRMRLEIKEYKQDASLNICYLNETVLKLEDYQVPFEQGFTKVYRQVQAKKNSLLKSGSLLFQFQHLKGRMVYQGTELYACLLEKGFAPHYLRCGLDRSFVFEYLFKCLSTPKERCFSFFDQELQQLERMDIPFFEVTPSIHRLSSEIVLEKSPFELALERIANLDEKKLFLQLTLIRITIKLTEKDSLFTTAQFPKECSKLSKKEWIEEAELIASKIEKSAHSFEDGSLSWYSFEPILEKEGYRISVLNGDLYSGALGLSLFFSALGLITEKKHYHKLAYATLKPYLEDFQKIERERLSHGMAGIGSQLYALSQIGKMSAKPELTKLAQGYCLEIDENFLKRDKILDVLLGTAGTLLGLLSYYKNSKEKVALEKALLCGDFLLEKRGMTESGHRAWATIENKYLTGFSHGAAGIAYALIELYQVTQEKRFFEAALESIQYERALFSSKDQNWPDLRPDSTGGCMTSWCHGAPGIGLARLATLPLLDTPEIRQEIEIASSTTHNYGYDRKDFLCCGNLGRLEFLHTAALKLKQPQMLETTLLSAARIVSRGKKHGFGVQSFEEIANPSLFTGLAGIGYAFLRFAEPQKIPNILLFEI